MSSTSSKIGQNQWIGSSCCYITSRSQAFLLLQLDFLLLQYLQRFFTPFVSYRCRYQCQYFTLYSQEGRFQWLSGDNLLFMNWFPNNPNNKGNNEDCVEFRIRPTTGTFGWNDLPCSDTERGNRILRPICKQEQTEIVSTFLHTHTQSLIRTHLINNFPKVRLA